MKLPPPWKLGTPPVLSDALLRFRLSWVQEGGEGAVGVVMYNPAKEGERLDDTIRDGATHRRVRHLLSAFHEIRVANLSPFRGTKPEEAYSWERLALTEVGVGLLGQGLLARDLAGATLHDARLDAVAWACACPVVVAAFGSGPRTSEMEGARDHLLHLASGRLYTWGVTASGEPYHPSPLNRRLVLGSPLQPWRPRSSA